MNCQCNSHKGHHMKATATGGASPVNCVEDGLVTWCSTAIPLHRLCFFSLFEPKMCLKDAKLVHLLDPSGPQVPQAWHQAMHLSRRNTDRVQPAKQSMPPAPLATCSYAGTK